MFDQVPSQFLNASKQAIDAMLKANSIAVDSFEKLAEAQLKAFATSATATQDFIEEFKDARSPEALHNALPKGVSLVKGNVELGYNTLTELLNISFKSVEQFANLANENVDAVAPAVNKAIKAAQKAGKVAA
jgi:Phasin protein